MAGPTPINPAFVVAWPLNPTNLTTTMTEWVIHQPLGHSFPVSWPVWMQAADALDAAYERDDDENWRVMMLVRPELLEVLKAAAEYVRVVLAAGHTTADADDSVNIQASIESFQLRLLAQQALKDAVREHISLTDPS